MALLLAVKDLVRATLPQGQGWVGFIGLSPQGDAYHLLAPLDLAQAQVMGALGLSGQAAILGARPGWRYRLCRPYNPPPPTAQGRPSSQAFRQARLAQALATGREITAWAGAQGWWVELGRS